MPVCLMKPLQVLMITGMVPATTPPMPKSEQSLWGKYGIIKNARLSLYVPFHGSEESVIYPALGSSRCGVNVPFG